MFITIAAYSLMIILIITLLINKSKLLSLYFILLFVCDFSGFLRQQLTNYPKPYEGIGFILFSITTTLLLAMPAVNLQLAIYTFHKKIQAWPWLYWLTVSIGLLIYYPTIRGQSMLDVFYAYYLVGGAASLIYFLSQAKKQFTFTQGGLFLASLASIITSLIAIKEVTILQMNYWILISACNCIFFLALIVCSIVNRLVKRLHP